MTEFVGKRSTLGIAVLACLLVLAMAVPAQAATRLRLYRGQTSQEEHINFVVAKTEAGRFVKKIAFFGTLTCEDQTTTGWGFGVNLSRREAPIADRAFSYDQNFGPFAVHAAGDLGRLHGDGTAAMISATLTTDEQAQLCTTSDLTWDVDFVRWL